MQNGNTEMNKKIHMLNARNNVIMQMVNKLNSNMYEEIFILQNTKWNNG